MKQYISSIIIALVLLFHNSIASANELSIEDLGHHLSIRFQEVVSQYETDWSDEERSIFYLLVPQQLQNIFDEESIFTFKIALDACKSAEDVRALFATEYLGITKAASESPTKEAITPIAEVILKDSKLYDKYPYRLYGPLLANSPLSEAWAVRMTDGIEASGHVSTLYLTSVGKLYWLENAEFRPSELKPLRTITEAERKQALTWTTTFTEKHSMIPDSAPVVISNSLLHIKDSNELFVYAYRPYSLPKSFWEKGEVNTDTYGDIIVWGLTTETLYEFHGFISENLLDEALFN